MRCDFRGQSKPAFSAQTVLKVGNSARNAQFHGLSLFSALEQNIQAYTARQKNLGCVLSSYQE